MASLALHSSSSSSSSFRTLGGNGGGGHLWSSRQQQKQSFSLPMVVKRRALQLPIIITTTIQRPSPCLASVKCHAKRELTAGVMEGKKEGKDSNPNLGLASEWDSLTSRMAEMSAIAFVLLQLPQIALNAQNLASGNIAALSAVAWIGQLAGLLGNLSLLSYFAKKRETGTMIVQGVGVVTTLVVLLQLTLATAMPRLVFAYTCFAVVSGFVLNILFYQNRVAPLVWEVWEDVTTIVGLSILPQVIWSTFEPYLPASQLPGLISCTLAVCLTLLRRFNMLPSKYSRSLEATSSWAANLLFMWPPVAQMWTNFLNPANIKGLSIYTILLAVVGNSLLLPRALFIRDVMWFIGVSWGTFLPTWGILLSMYMCDCVSAFVFWGVGGILFLWLGTILFHDAKAKNLKTILAPLHELLSS